MANITKCCPSGLISSVGKRGRRKRKDQRCSVMKRKEGNARKERSHERNDREARMEDRCKNPGKKEMNRVVRGRKRKKIKLINLNNLHPLL